MRSSPGVIAALTRCLQEHEDRLSEWYRRKELPDALQEELAELTRQLQRKWEQQDAIDVDALLQRNTPEASEASPRARPAGRELAAPRAELLRLWLQRQPGLREQVAAQLQLTGEEEWAEAAEQYEGPLRRRGAVDDDGLPAADRVDPEDLCAAALCDLARSAGLPVDAVEGCGRVASAVLRHQDADLSARAEALRDESAPAKAAFQVLRRGARRAAQAAGGTLAVLRRLRDAIVAGARQVVRMGALSTAGKAWTDLIAPLPPFGSALDPAAGATSGAGEDAEPVEIRGLRGEQAALDGLCGTADLRQPGATVAVTVRGVEVSVPRESLSPAPALAPPEPPPETPSGTAFEAVAVAAARIARRGRSFDAVSCDDAYRRLCAGQVLDPATRALADGALSPDDLVETALGGPAPPGAAQRELAVRRYLRRALTHGAPAAPEGAPGCVAAALAAAGGPPKPGGPRGAASAAAWARDAAQALRADMAHWGPAALAAFSAVAAEPPPPEVGPELVAACVALDSVSALGAGGAPPELGARTDAACAAALARCAHPGAAAGGGAGGPAARRLWPSVGDGSVHDGVAVLPGGYAAACSLGRLAATPRGPEAGAVGAVCAAAAAAALCSAAPPEETGLRVAVCRWLLLQAAAGADLGECAAAIRATPAAAGALGALAAAFGRVPAVKRLKSGGAEAAAFVGCPSVEELQAAAEAFSSAAAGLDGVQWARLLRLCRRGGPPEGCGAAHPPPELLPAALLVAKHFPSALRGGPAGMDARRKAHLRLARAGLLADPEAGVVAQGALGAEDIPPGCVGLLRICGGAGPADDGLRGPLLTQLGSVWDCASHGALEAAEDGSVNGMPFPAELHAACSELAAAGAQLAAAADSLSSDQAAALAARCMAATARCAAAAQRDAHARQAWAQLVPVAAAFRKQGPGLGARRKSYNRAAASGEGSVPRRQTRGSIAKRHRGGSLAKRRGSGMLSGASPEGAPAGRRPSALRADAVSPEFGPRPSSMLSDGQSPGIGRRPSALLSDGGLSPGVGRSPSGVLSSSGQSPGLGRRASALRSDGGLSPGLSGVGRRPSGMLSDAGASPGFGRRPSGMLGASPAFGKPRLSIAGGAPPETRLGVSFSGGDGGGSVRRGSVLPVGGGAEQVGRRRSLYAPGGGGRRIDPGLGDDTDSDEEDGLAPAGAVSVWDGEDEEEEEDEECEEEEEDDWETGDAARRAALRRLSTTTLMSRVGARRRPAYRLLGVSPGVEDEELFAAFVEHGVRAAVDAAVADPAKRASALTAPGVVTACAAAWRLRDAESRLEYAASGDEAGSVTLPAGAPAPAQIWGGFFFGDPPEPLPAADLLRAVAVAPPEEAADVWRHCAGLAAYPQRMLELVRRGLAGSAAVALRVAAPHRRDSSAGRRRSSGAWFQLGVVQWDVLQCCALVIDTLCRHPVLAEASLAALRPHARDVNRALVTALSPPGGAPGAADAAVGRMRDAAVRALLSAAGALRDPAAALRRPRYERAATQVQRLWRGHRARARAKALLRHCAAMRGLFLAAAPRGLLHTRCLRAAYAQGLGQRMAGRELRLKEAAAAECVQEAATYRQRAEAARAVHMRDADPRLQLLRAGAEVLRRSPLRTTAVVAEHARCAAAACSIRAAAGDPAPAARAASAEFAVVLKEHLAGSKGDADVHEAVLALALAIAETHFFSGDFAAVEKVCQSALRLSPCNEPILRLMRSADTMLSTGVMSARATARHGHAAATGEASGRLQLRDAAAERDGLARDARRAARMRRHAVRVRQQRPPPRPVSRGSERGVQDAPSDVLHEVSFELDLLLLAEDERRAGLADRWLSLWQGLHRAARAAPQQ